MTKSSLEQLVAWLVAALAIKVIVGKSASLYIQTKQSSATTASEQVHLMSQAMAYQEAAFLIFGLLVNLVIAVWLFKHTASKNILWAALGLLASWWALVVFALHHYSVAKHENT